MAGFWSRVAGNVGVALGVPEKRDLSKQSVFGGGFSDPTSDVAAGVSVSQTSALQLISVYACIHLLADSIAVLPIDAFRTVGLERQLVPRAPLWLTMPNPETTWFEFSERLMSSLNIDGNAFVLITARDSTGYPSELWTLNPQQVQVYNINGVTSFRWLGGEKLTRYGPMSPGGDVLHIKAFNDGGLRGLSPIDVARQGIGLGLVTEKSGAAFFGRGQTLSGVITLPPQNATNSSESQAQIAESWKKRHSGSDKAYNVAVLTGGATWTPLSVTPEEAQFLETRKFQVTEIARLFQVPPHMIGDVEKSTSWGTGIEQQSIGFVQYSLLPWMARLEQALSQLLPRGQFVKFNEKVLLRGDSAAQTEAYAKAIQNGWRNRAEVRRLEDLPSDDPDLEKYLYPSNLKVVGDPEPLPPPPPPPQPDAMQMAMAGMRSMKPQNIDVTLPEMRTQVDVHVPESRVEVQAPEVTVHVPEFPTPVVNVAPAEAPDVTVNVAPAEAPEIHVDAPEVNVAAPEVNVTVEQSELEVIRDPKTSRITGTRKKVK